MVKQYLQYVIIIILSVVFVAIAVALWDFYQTGQPLKGQRIADVIWHGLYIFVLVIISREVPATIGSYLIVIIFTAWVSQPDTREKIGKWLR